MRDLFWLTEDQLSKIEPFFPLSHGVPRVDDRRVISGIIFVIQGSSSLSRAKGITPCIPPRRGRKAPETYCKTTYKQRHKIKSMFGGLKDWRRVATRYDRFFSAVLIASVVIYWLY